MGRGKRRRRRQTCLFPLLWRCPPPGRLQSFEVQFVMLSLLLLFPNAGAGDSETAQFGCKNSGHTIPPPFGRRGAGRNMYWIHMGGNFFQKSCVEEGEGGDIHPPLSSLALLPPSHKTDGRIHKMPNSLCFFRVFWRSRDFNWANFLPLHLQSLFIITQMRNDDG